MNNMKIRIKTSLIEIEIEDHVIMGDDGFTKHRVPELPNCLESAISQAVILHNEVLGAGDECGT